MVGGYLPKGDGVLKPCTGVPGVPNGMGPGAALWPKAGVAVPAQQMTCVLSRGTVKHQHKKGTNDKGHELLLFRNVVS